jgi:hypothetical protein
VSRLEIQHGGIVLESPAFTSPVFEVSHLGGMWRVVSRLEAADEDCDEGGILTTERLRELSVLCALAADTVDALNAGKSVTISSRKDPA